MSVLRLYGKLTGRVTWYSELVASGMSATKPPFMLLLNWTPTGNPAVNLPAATFTQIQPSSRNLSGKVPVVDDVTTDAVIEYANSDIKADGRWWRYKVTEGVGTDRTAVDEGTKLKRVVPFNWNLSSWRSFFPTRRRWPTMTSFSYSSCKAIKISIEAHLFVEVFLIFHWWILCSFWKFDLIFLLWGTLFAFPITWVAYGYSILVSCFFFVKFPVLMLIKQLLFVCPSVHLYVCLSVCLSV